MATSFISAATVAANVEISENNNAVGKLLSYTKAIYQAYNHPEDAQAWKSVIAALEVQYGHAHTSYTAIRENHDASIKQGYDSAQYRTRVGRAWMVDTMLKDLLETAKQFRDAAEQGSRHPSEEDAMQLLDHQVLRRDFVTDGSFSKYDLIQLLEGEFAGFKNKQRQTNRRGMLNHLSPKTASIVATDKGFKMFLNGEDWYITGADLYQMIIRMVKRSNQRVPFTQETVLLNFDPNAATQMGIYDGMTFLLPQGSFEAIRAESGEVVTVTHPQIRVVMHFTTWKTVFQAVKDPMLAQIIKDVVSKEGALPISDEERLALEQGKTLFIPNNRLEQQWVSDLFLFRTKSSQGITYRKSESEGARYFRPNGYFDIRGITLDDLFSLEAHSEKTLAYESAQEARLAASRAKAQATREANAAANATKSQGHPQNAAGAISITPKPKAKESGNTLAHLAAEMGEIEEDEELDDHPF